MDATTPGHTIWTIGHWTCPKPVFLEPLLAAEIELLADVRALPGSRRSPQFDADEMPAWLEEVGIDYLHLTDLGGRRRKQEVDPKVNAAWQNASFKNYADYTLTEGFQHGLAELERLAEQQHVVIMCGEPMPWRCHRLLISNVLAARGWSVQHLMTTAPPREHRLGQWGAAPHVDPDGTVTYPATEDADD
ncbi:DUF488 family protein [Nocardioides daejeonensis]|uniref:DUF488 domain-containing protein n=1 Tax=Nocardioides daejeonensis TaxID=1046556 RepID=UPI000D7507C3|nr:DUF488 domain-containing protein [Nocardioides daejeonensis]